MKYINAYLKPLKNNDKEKDKKENIVSTLTITVKWFLYISGMLANL